MRAFLVALLYSFQATAGVTAKVPALAARTAIARSSPLVMPVVGSSFSRQASPFGQVAPVPSSAGYTYPFNYGPNPYNPNMPGFNPNMPIAYYPFQQYQQPKRPSLLLPLIGLGAVGLLGSAAAMGGGGSLPIGGLPSDVSLPGSGFFPGGGSSRVPITSHEQALEEVRSHPTQAQKDCLAKAPKTPTRVVFGFSGLFSYGAYEGAIYGMLGNNVKNVDFHYYPWDAADSGNITDATRCAYELATKPYITASGKTVYNTIVILGHSFGGGGAHNLAQSLKALGVDVDLATFADPRESANTMGGNVPNWGKPGNVGRCYSFFQQSSGLPGYPVNGCNNDQTGGSHLSEPGEAALKNAMTKEMAWLPTCKNNYGNSVYSGDYDATTVTATSCDGATEAGDNYVQASQQEASGQQ